MIYKHLDHAFLFEALVGLIAVLAVAFFGRVGLAAVAVIAIRPFVLQRLPIVPDEAIWRLYYNALRLAVILTTVSVALTYLAFELELSGGGDRRLILYLMFPWFMLAHGFIGFVLSYRRI